MANDRTTDTEHFLRTIRQLKGNAVLLKKENGIFQTAFVSEDFARMIECAPERAMEKMIGSGFVETTHPDDRLSVRRMLRRRMSENGGEELQIRKLTDKGNTIWCKVHFAFLEEGGEQYVYCTYSDITLQKEYEERLRSSYMGLGDSFYQRGDLALGMFRVNLTKDRIEDMQGKDLYGTDSMVRSYSEVVRMRAWNYPIQEEQEQFLEMFDRERLIEEYQEGKTQHSCYLFSQRRDGTLCFVNYAAVLTRHPMTGDIIAFITELECNRDKVIETLIDKILSRQFDMVAYLANGRYGVVFGDASLIEKGSIFPLEKEGSYTEWLEHQVIPVLYGDDEERGGIEAALRPEAIEAGVAEHEPYYVNVQIEIDGERYHKRFDYYCIDPQAQFYILLKSDITEAQREQMERNIQLNNALKAAEEANMAKTVFLSRLSHEIRTPMTTIVGLDNIALQEQGVSGETRDYLEKIGVSARYMLTIINDILDMSRIESGRLSVRYNEFSFKSFLDQINTMVFGQCQDRGISYDCVLLGTVGEYYIGDDVKLKQLLLNILDNAVKFTKPGGSVMFGVEEILEHENDCLMRFTIEDTGIGMDKEFLPHIFESFSQEDETTAASYRGAGLGLAIAKNFADMMDGTISVKSEKGFGSTFTVELELMRADREEKKNFEVNLDELRVLVVDDDPAVCRRAQMEFGTLGVKTDTCLNGEEALDAIEVHRARRERYQLILIDWKLPEKDGVEVAREIRRVLGDEEAVIILAAYNWSQVEDEAVRAGVDSFLLKPVFASDAILEYQDALQRKRGEGAGEEKEIDLSGKRILLAEDVFINAEIMKHLLELKGMEVEHVGNGKLAVDAFLGRPEGYFDAVLMDVRMPIMDGLEATETIRGLGREDTDRVPIIAMTANAFDEDVQRSLQAGMDIHLSKPVDPENLYSTLSDLLRRDDRE